MSTYANPTTVIDRESGKIWSNTVDTIGKLTVGALDAIEKRRSAQAKKDLEKLKTLSANQIKQGDYLAKTISQNGIKSPQVENFLRSTGDSIAKLETSIQFEGDPNVVQEKLNQLNKLKSSRATFINEAGNFQDNINNYVFSYSGQDAKGNSIPQIGSPEGMSVVGSNETQEYHTIMQTVSGLGEGKLESFDVRNGMIYGVLSGTGNKELDGKEINLTLKMNYDPGDNIDFVGTSMEEALQPMKNENGKFKDKYLDKNLATVRQTQDGKREYTETPYNYAAISQEAGSILDATAEGIMDGYSYNDLNTWMQNNGAIKNEDVSQLEFDVIGGKKILSDKGRERFKQKLLELSEGLIPKEEITNERERVGLLAPKQGSLTKISKEKITDLSARELDAQDIKNEASREVTELIENPGEVILTKYRRNLPGAKVSDDGQVITIVKESKYVGEEDEVIEFDLRDPKSIYSLYEEIIDPSNMSETKLLKEIEKQAEKQIKDIKSNTKAGDKTLKQKGLSFNADILNKYKDSQK